MQRKITSILRTSAILIGLAVQISVACATMLMPARQGREGCNG